MSVSKGVWNVACDSYGKVQHSRKYDCVFTVLKNTSTGDRIVTVAARIEERDNAKAIAAVPLMLKFIQDWAEAGDKRARLILDAIESNHADAYYKATEELNAT